FLHLIRRIFCFFLISLFLIYDTVHSEICTPSLHDALPIFRSARERTAARLRSLEEERARGEEGERWRTMGELIYAYLASIEPGQTELQVDGLTIPLDPALSPSENAQAYFERYRKARSATENLPELIEATRTELAYLEQLETLAGF